ncbi:MULTISPECIES: putative signal transducing protein [unclassified Sedimentibacter]|uniref:putative signal transducing protein n=1 Tax=unclassified Sedimentibacter TaxID=2649220 RepID=UPI0027E16D6B|nr:DUF2007 domain-containing protein [Sedimentibacter sp. MB35-C1]WMJ76411.1 DUF2007 domain-containing protein [Sedimentibacter sp. MB35-C1]
MINDNVDDNKEELLASNLNTIEAEIIASKLTSYGIPVLKKSKGSGEIMEIYTGVNLYGIDIYVPTHMSELARELLKPVREEDSSE